MIINSGEINLISIKENVHNLLKKSFFIDIETTGLSREYSDIISITVLLYENSGYKITQIFCEYSIDEPEALKYLYELISKKEYIITYNGNSFDIPFLMRKMQKYNIDFDLSTFTKVDLYYWMRNIKSKIEIQNLKLKTAEKYFNINRNDTLSGEDIITLYKAYRIEPRKEFAELILQHNYEDVFNLPLLFSCILDMYDNILHYDNLMVSINSESAKIKKNTLICKCNIISALKTNYVNTNINFSLKTNLASQTMELHIPLDFFNDDKIMEFFFIDNINYKVPKYTAIEGIKRNLLPIKFNDKIFYTNISNLIKTVLDSIFK